MRFFIDTKERFMVAVQREQEALDEAREAGYRDAVIAMMRMDQASWAWSVWLASLVSFFFGLAVGIWL